MRQYRFQNHNFKYALGVISLTMALGMLLMLFIASRVIGLIIIFLLLIICYNCFCC